MENNFEQYGTLLDSASEAAETCLDIEGGAFFLAWDGELIQDLVAEGYCRSARLTTQKLCEAVGVDRTWADCNELERMEKQVWLNLFARNLRACLKSSNKDGNESKSKNLGGGEEFALAIFPKPAEFVEPAE